MFLHSYTFLEISYNHFKPSLSTKQNVFSNIFATFLTLDSPPESEDIMKNEDHPFIRTPDDENMVEDVSLVGKREKDMIKDVLDFFHFGNTLNGDSVNSVDGDGLKTSSILQEGKLRKYGK